MIVCRPPELLVPFRLLWLLSVFIPQVLPLHPGLALAALPPAPAAPAPAAATAAAGTAAAAGGAGASVAPGTASSAAAGGPAVAAPAEVPAQLLSDGDLDRLYQTLLSSDAQVRLRAARTIAGADPEGYPVYAARLGREVPGSAAAIKHLIHAIWGQYPNPDYPRGPGKDPPMWFTRTEPPIPPGTPRNKRPRPHDPDAVDWLTALAELDLGQDPPPAEVAPAELPAVRAEMVLRVGLLRAIAAAGRTSTGRDAVYPLFQFAFVRDGLFRDECGRAIRSMGSYGIPGLIRIYNNRTRSNFKMRRYASYQLDRMDRLRPSKAIATAPDDVVRADIIHAYGEVLALDAVEAIVEQVGARSHRVRREARWAWLRYVDGPPPPPAPKRKRKLPGGKEESEEKEDYLNYREMATLTLQRIYQELWNEPPSPKLSAKELTELLFQHYDRIDEQLFEQLFKSAKAHESAGDLEKALDEFGWILANQPDHPRRAEMSDVFGRYGEALAEKGETAGRWDDVARGVGWLRQALALHPDRPDAAKVRALVHFLDGKLAQQKGGDGRSDFELAVAADPSLGRAQKALRAVTPPAVHRRGTWWVLLGSGTLLLAVFLLLWRRLPRV